MLGCCEVEVLGVLKEGQGMRQGLPRGVSLPNFRLRQGLDN